MTQEQRNKKAEQLRLAAQIIETGCEFEAMHPVPDKKWGLHVAIDPMLFVYQGCEIRLPSTVIPVPEGWRELRDDEKDGRWIEGAKYLGYRGDWKYHEASVNGDGCYGLLTSRVIVPVAKPRVPLGPEDVVPGSVVRASTFANGVFSMIVHQNFIGLSVANQYNEIETLGWGFLMDNNWSIKRPTDTEWQPCSKEVES